ncbi:MAG: hypothetical protein R6U37_03060 [Dehalococcoidia bacterium]
MAQWHCHKCKVEVEEKEIELTYMDMPGFQLAWVCPKCNGKWISEKVVMEEIIPGQEELEAKLA